MEEFMRDMTGLALLTILWTFAIFIIALVIWAIKEMIDF